MTCDRCGCTVMYDCACEPDEVETRLEAKSYKCRKCGQLWLRGCRSMWKLYVPVAPFVGFDCENCPE